MPERLSIFGPNLRDQQSKGSFVVHAADCADCRKLRGEDAYTAEFESKLEAVLTMYDPDDFGFDANSIEACDAYFNDFHFAPCVTVPDRKPE